MTFATKPRKAREIYTIRSNRDLTVLTSSRVSVKKTGDDEYTFFTTIKLPKCHKWGFVKRILFRNVKKLGYVFEIGGNCSRPFEVNFVD